MNEQVVLQRLDEIELCGSNDPDLSWLVQICRKLLAENKKIRAQASSLVVKTKDFLQAVAIWRDQVSQYFGDIDSIIKAALKLLSCRPTLPGSSVCIFCGSVLDVANGWEVHIQGCPWFELQEAFWKFQKNVGNAARS